LKPESQIYRGSHDKRNCGELAAQQSKHAINPIASTVTGDKCAHYGEKILYAGPKHFGKL